jgi:predicted nucleic acid-binding protein
MTERAYFEKLADYISAFPLIELKRDDYIEAAGLRNYCITKGIQASTIDFLIASVCVSKDFLLFSADKDFELIANVTDLKLLKF